MLRWLLVILLIAGIIMAAMLVFDSPLLRLTTIIAGACLVLWLSESVPPFVSGSN